MQRLLQGARGPILFFTETETPDPGHVSLLKMLAHFVSGRQTEGSTPQKIQAVFIEKLSCICRFHVTLLRDFISCPHSIDNQLSNAH